MKGYGVDDIVDELPIGSYDNLFVTDLEGTLTNGFSVFGELNKAFGMTKEEDDFLYNRFFYSERGDGDEALWTRDMVRIWGEGRTGNAPTPEFINSFIKDHYSPINGAREFVKELEDNNYLVAVVSNGLEGLCELAKQDLGFHYFTPGGYFEFEQGEVAGITNSPYLFDKKADALNHLLEAFELKYGRPPSTVFAMGDSDNDFELLVQAASLDNGLAFLINPSEKVGDELELEIVGKGVLLVPDHDYGFVLEKLGGVKKNKK